LFNVFTVSQNTQPVIAVNGLVVVPQYSFHNHPPIHILVIAGGQGTRKLLHDPTVLAWIEKDYTSRITLSICSGARLLGKIGLLDNKPFCTHHLVYEHLSEIAPLGIPQRDRRFVQTDDYTYTSGGISAGIDLSFHIVEKLAGKEVAERTANYMEYVAASIN
jgi:transcriptional regulator GlxA family with amidase domain